MSCYGERFMEGRNISTKTRKDDEREVTHLVSLVQSTGFELAMRNPRILFEILVIRVFDFNMG